MSFAHEMINYTNELVPVKWIIHDIEDMIDAVLPHWHTSIEITFIYQGNVDIFTVNNNACKIQSGDFVVVNSAEIHSAISAKDKHVRGVTLLIPYDLFNKYIDEFEFSRFINFPTDEHSGVKEIKVLLEKFYWLITQDKKQFLALQLIQIVYELMYLMAKYLIIKEKIKINYNLHNDNLGEVLPIINYIKENYQEPLTVKSIGEKFYLSENALSKSFKKNIGISVMKYVQLLRVNQAQLLLLDSEKSIATISCLAGFPNEKSFRKIFEDVFHQTPKKYQLDHLKK
ncbi:MAG: AraC family transcriptional regulator [Lactococcus sp.]|nr:helix-turn-helix domain-containing protein [Lactococcus sp.]MDN5465629.1 AraC family transcriptional regulator [Lactococcus sp.]